MGYWKNRKIEEDDQGWGYSSESICVKCLYDPHLKKVAREKLEHDKCDFCGRKGKPIAAPFDVVMKTIADAVFQYWNYAGNEPIAYDSEDHRYVGETWDTWDLVHEVIPSPSESEAVLKHITERLGDEIWCEKNPYVHTGAERYIYSWEQFCNTVKHDNRYFFESIKDEEVPDHIPVPQMLDALSDIIGDTGLIAELPASTPFYRIRVHKPKDKCDAWDSLGAPPPQRCVSNRMSAAGISVFYAGMDLATAQAETVANLKRTDRRILTAATWTNTRAFTVLDLTKLPDIPEFYGEYRHRRDDIAFLHEFVEDIRKPVKHDGREHIDYVPTQILTEYFRHRYKAGESRALDGIVYKSAQRLRGRSIVIFASHDALDPSGESTWGGGKPILELDAASIRRIKRKKP